MTTANKGRIPLAQVAQVVIELKKSKDKLVILTQDLKREKERSQNYWRDSKGDDFRDKVQQIIALNTRVAETMKTQLRALCDYYEQAEAQEKAHFDGGKI